MKISGILGHPLKKPRSIKIWKDYFSRKGINSSMVKFDIKPKNLANFFENIKVKKNFQAMAVTMPYKKKVIKFTDKLDKFATMAGAVNLIIKKNNNLIGFNTDVYGAYLSIKKELQKNNKIVIIGLGGTGQAIFNFLYNKFKKKQFILISRKFKIKRKKNIKIFQSLNEKIFTEKLIIINCTPLGSNLKTDFLKQTPIKSKFLKKN